MTGSWGRPGEHGRRSVLNTFLAGSHPLAVPPWTCAGRQSRSDLRFQVARLSPWCPGKSPESTRRPCSTWVVDMRVVLSRGSEDPGQCEWICQGWQADLHPGAQWLGQNHAAQRLGWSTKRRSAASHSDHRQGAPGLAAGRLRRSNKVCSFSLMDLTSLNCD